MAETERWKLVARVLDEALSRDPSEWSSVLDESCSGDPELRHEVESLLARVDDAARFLESPPATAAAALLAEADEAARAGYEGTRVGAYRIVREIGRGGMARVFLAERADGAFASRVALKLLRRGLDSDIDLGRFRVERQILAGLAHPHIARLLDGGVTGDGRPYLVLEYVEGEPIDRYCERRGLGVAERVDLFLTVVEATQYAHRNLIVHRDLKPSNILVTAEGQAKLLDFGLAKLLEPRAIPFAAPTTVAGHRPMTPEYAAREQILGEPVTTVTDVYQLGAVLYELLTGRMPFGRRGASLHELEEAVLRAEPPPPSSVAPHPVRKVVRGDLDAIVLKALRKEPDRRYASAAALLGDLRSFREGRPVLARSGAVAYRVGRFVRRHRVGVAAAAGLVALLAAAGVRERVLRARAQEEARRATAVEHFLQNVFNAADPYAPPTVHPGDVTARELLDRGAARIDSALAGQPEVQADLRRVFGDVYSDLGMYDRAAPLLRRALAQRRALDGPRSPAVAAAMDALGVVLDQRDSLDQAEPLLRDALAERRHLLGERDTATATSLDHLATLLQDRGLYAKAEPLFREALNVRRSLLGDTAQRVASSFNNLGVLLFLRADYAGADSMYRQAEAIDERTLGEDQPQIADDLHNLAQVDEQLGRFAVAESLYRRALAIKRKTLGDLHPSVTINMNNLAGLISRDDARLGEAEALLRRALALDRKMFGEKHDYVAEDLRKLARTVGREGKFGEAFHLYQESIGIERALHGTEGDYVAVNLFDMAETLRDSGDLDRAVPLLRRAVALVGEAYGENSSRYASYSIGLGVALAERGDAPEAREAERLLRIASGRIDTTDAYERAGLMSAQVGIGEALTAEGRPRAALPMLVRTLTMIRAHVGDDHWRTGEASLALGECLEAMGDRARAVHVLEGARAVLARHARGRPALLARATRSLARARSSLAGDRRRRGTSDSKATGHRTSARSGSAADGERANRPTASRMRELPADCEARGVLPLSPAAHSRLEDGRTSSAGSLVRSMRPVPSGFIEYTS